MYYIHPRTWEEGSPDSQGCSAMTVLGSRIPWQLLPCQPVRVKLRVRLFGTLTGLESQPKWVGKETGPSVLGQRTNIEDRS